MDAQLPDATVPQPSTKPLQFSLKWLMILVTAVALLIALAIILEGIVPPMLRGIFPGLLTGAALLGVLPTVFIVGALYGRGKLRVFSIGALVPLVPLLAEPSAVMDLEVALVLAIVVMIMSSLCGLVAVGARHWIVSRNLGPGEPY